MNNLRAASVQFRHEPGDKAANLETIGRFVERAAGKGVELVVFPECCISGYWHLNKLSRVEIEALSEPVPAGPSCEVITELSAKHNITIGAGLVERGEDGELYNAYFVAMPDGRWVNHRKLHTFVSEHMSSGDSYTVFDLPSGVRAGVLTCYDNNIIENARMTALMGAEVLIAPHQTGGCDSRSPFAMGLIDPALWENRVNDPEALRSEMMGDKGRGWVKRWLPARAHDNGMFVIFSNGVGEDDGEVRTGGSMILDPYGRVMGESDAIGDDMVVADLDGALRERCTGMRWMRGRRPELYGQIAEVKGSEVDARAARFE